MTWTELSVGNSKSYPMLTVAGYSEPFGYGNTFKVEAGNVPDFEITNSVFLHEYDSQKMLLPDIANVISCSSNTIIWLDPHAGTAPTSQVNALNQKFPGCFTIITDHAQGKTQ